MENRRILYYVGLPELEIVILYCVGFQKKDKSSLSYTVWNSRIREIVVILYCVGFQK